MPVTFAVSPVEPSSTALTRVPLRALLAARRVDGVDGCGANAPELCVLPTTGGPHAGNTLALHGFIAALRAAFDLHLPLVLSPDDVWLCVAQGFAAHVTASAEALSSRFVRHEGTEHIVVRRDEFSKGAPDNPWPEVFAAFSDKLAEHIGRKRDLVVADFSTTGPVERAVSEVVLLDAVRSYFTYEFRSFCGIPSVTLLGTEDDWRRMRVRVENLAEFDLKWWCNTLLPVIDQLIAASRGRADVDFWRSIYKLKSASGGPYVTGWCNALFPYVREDRGDLVRNPWAAGWLKGMSSPMGGGTTDPGFPSGLSSAPFMWNDRGALHPMRFVGGFVGVAQSADGAVRPAQAWAVCDDTNAPSDDPAPSAKAPGR